MGEIREFRSNTSGIPRQPEPLHLAAVVVGDISGCGRPMRSDEEEMRRRIQRIERELIEPSILEHHGRLVKTTADGFVAIFDSPVEAARCSIIYSAKHG
jgi:class 3 adenylate cyclase